MFLCTLVYVDDLIITRTYSETIQKFKRHVFVPTKSLDILTDARLLGAKSISFPMEQNHKLGKAKVLFDISRFLSVPCRTFDLSHHHLS